MRHWLETARRAASAHHEESKGEPPLAREEAKAGPASLEVHPLPGGVGVSGEWFLGVWGHSAVPNTALKILETLTSQEAQLERVHLGIGLPASDTLLAERAAQFLPGARLRALDLAQIVPNAMRRSRLYRYDALRPLLAQHLIEFLNATRPNKSTIKRVTKGLAGDFKAAIRG